jgi:hypothetical protein
MKFPILNSLEQPGRPRTAKPQSISKGRASPRPQPVENRSTEAAKASSPRPHTYTPPPKPPAQTSAPSPAPAASTETHGQETSEAKPCDSTMLGKGMTETEWLETFLFSLQSLDALGMEKQISLDALRLYFDRLLEQAGNPTDPVEKMLLCQTFLAHHMIPELHGRAKEAIHVPRIQCYENSAARLTSAFCQLTSALTTRQASRRSADSQPESKKQSKKRIRGSQKNAQRTKK